MTRVPPGIIPAMLRVTARILAAVAGLFAVSGAVLQATGASGRVSRGGAQSVRRL